MSDPYTFLGEELAKAAERRKPHSRRHKPPWSWLSRRTNAAVAAAVLVLAGGAVAVAATGLLSGSPVIPEVTPSPVAGNGLPEPGSSSLALETADPSEALGWGMRVLPTTRGALCVQVGRVQDGQLGDIGIDGAFGNDGRFHALPPDVLPPGSGGASSDGECALQGRPFIVEDANSPRGGERLLPGIFKGTLPVADLRSISYGLLGPHAVSVTYRTPSGFKTVPVAGPVGAFLRVDPATSVIKPYTVGTTLEGEATSGSVQLIVGASPRAGALVSAVTFRFGSLLCSQGSGAPVENACPMQIRPTPLPPQPARSLDEPIHLTLLQQSPAACSAAYLREPCFKAQLEFTAPYAVTSAATDYVIEGFAKCSVGGRVESGRVLERNVRKDETVRTVAFGLFIYTPSCASSEGFKVTYQRQTGSATPSGQESVTLGATTLSKAEGIPAARSLLSP